MRLADEIFVLTSQWTFCRQCELLGRWLQWNQELICCDICWMFSSKHRGDALSATKLAPSLAPASDGANWCRSIILVLLTTTHLYLSSEVFQHTWRCNIFELLKCELICHAKWMKEGRNEWQPASTHSWENNHTPIQITQAIYFFFSRKKMKTQNIKKLTPLNYMGSYKQNKVSFYIYISRGNDRGGGLLGRSLLNHHSHLCQEKRRTRHHHHNPSHDCTACSEVWR